MEIFLGAYFIHKKFFEKFDVTKVFVGTQTWNNPDQNNVQANIVKLIYPDAKVIEGNSCLGCNIYNALIVDRVESNRYTSINKFLDSFKYIGGKWAGLFRETILAAISKKLAINFVNSKAILIHKTRNRVFTPEVERRLNAILIDKGYSIKHCDFSAMCWEDQVEETASAALCYGVHGNR
jgi:hypothetical protein